MNRPSKNLGWAFLAALLSVAIASAAPDYPLTQYLSMQSATSPSTDPTSQEVLYVTSISGAPQVWKMSAFSGYQTQVTFDTNGVGRAWWSPRDKGLMVVSRAVGGNERWQLYLTDPSGGVWNRVTENDSAIYTFGDWSRDGSRFAYSTNVRNKRDFDVYEYNVDAAHHFLLYKGESQNDAADYSPDHRRLLIVRHTSNANSDLLLYDRANGKTRVLTKHSGDVVYKNPVWGGDGQGFYFLTDQGRDFVGLAYWPLDSAAFRWVDTPERDVEEVAVSSDGVYLAWTTNNGGYSDFHFRNLARGTQLPPNRTPLGIIRGLTFAQDNGQLLFTFGGPTRPTDIWTYETAADRLHQLTASVTGGIPAATLRAPNLIDYESFDGRRIPAFWYAPAEAAGPVPVIVMAHGGPESQARPALNGLYQYFLNRGYAILEPNVRGSSGYGKAYLALDNGRKRLDSVQDFAYAARWLKARSDVDSTRLVIYGGSYGGYIALASLVNDPQTWAAGVSLVGITNFVTFLENTGAYRRAQREAEYGSLAADREFLTEISPLTHVDRITAPLFLVQGANDPRVPQSEADQMAAALRERGRTVEYLLFGDEGHGLKKLNNRIAAYSAIAAFLDRHTAPRDLGGK